MRLDHVVIPCFDAGATLAFYGETLGLPLVGVHEGDDWGGHPWLMMIFSIGDGREIVLVALKGATAPANPLPADSRHYAFAVETPGELQSWRARLTEAGIGFDEEDHGAQQSIYFPDRPEICSKSPLRRARLRMKPTRTRWPWRYAGSRRLERGEMPFSACPRERSKRHVPACRYRSPLLKSPP